MAGHALLQYAAQLEASRLQALPPDVQRLAREADPLSGRHPEVMPAKVAMLPPAQPLQLALARLQVRATGRHGELVHVVLFDSGLPGSFGGRLSHVP